MARTDIHDQTSAPTRAGTTGRPTVAGTTTTHRTPLQVASAVVGATFLLVGIAGFIPGITQDLDQMEWIGHESGAELLGLFQVNVTHNIVHLLFGLLGLWAATRWTLARTFLIGGGLVYLALWLYGLVVELDSAANSVSLNEADNWLHLGLGLGMVALGALLGNRREVDVRERTA